MPPTANAALNRKPTAWTAANKGMETLQTKRMHAPLDDCLTQGLPPFGRRDNQADCGDNTPIHTSQYKETP